MKRIKIEEPIVFDMEYKDATLRVKIEGDGITFWKRASQGNLDAPRPLDKTVEARWDAIGNAGYCYSGTKCGVKEGRGPASSRGGLHYLTHKQK